MNGWKSSANVALLRLRVKKTSLAITSLTATILLKSAEQSLINLATDHLDLLLIHRPDPLMDADEVADAFKHLHQSGKVRHFGVSNFTPAQFALLQSRLPFTLATNQVEISPVHQPLLLDGTLDQLQQLRVRPMAWSCLGGGRLFNDDYFQPLRDELAVVAEELNAGSIEQVVYALGITFTVAAAANYRLR